LVDADTRGCFAKHGPRVKRIRRDNEDLCLYNAELKQIESLRAHAVSLFTYKAALHFQRDTI